MRSCEPSRRTMSARSGTGCRRWPRPSATAAPASRTRSSCRRTPCCRRRTSRSTRRASCSRARASSRTCRSRRERMSREVVLARRPEGEPQESDFEVREGEGRQPGDGEVLVENVWVSVDPYMRSRMTGVRTYVGPYEVGEVVDGGAVGRVAASRHEGFDVGDWVLSGLGWRERGVAPGSRLRKLDPDAAPPSTALGVLGMPGFTAWIGLVDIGAVREDETIYVSGAAGAVGSAAAQIAKLKGLRVIGSAGSAEKVEWLRSLGIDAFDYRATPVREALA